jgi:hypothetical protein
MWLLENSIQTNSQHNGPPSSHGMQQKLQLNAALLTSHPARLIPAPAKQALTHFFPLAHTKGTGTLSRVTCVCFSCQCSPGNKKTTNKNGKP